MSLFGWKRVRVPEVHKIEWRDEVGQVVAIADLHMLSEKKHWRRTRTPFVPESRWPDDNSWPQGSAGGLMGTEKVA